MPLSALISIQACLSLAAFYYFVRSYRMAPKRAILIGVFAYAFMPVVLIFASGDIGHGLALMPFSFSVLIGVGLAVLPPKRMRVSEQHVALVALTAVYPLVVDRDSTFAIHIAIVLVSVLFAAIQIFQRDRIAQARRFLLFVSYCYLMVYLVFYQGNFYVAYVKMMNPIAFVDILLWAGQSLLMQITIIATAARVIYLAMLLPQKREYNYIQRMRDKTIPLLSQRVDARSADPKKTFLTLGAHAGFLILNEITDLLAPEQMVAVALVVLPILYDVAFHTHSRLNEVDPDLEKVS